MIGDLGERRWNGRAAQKLLKRFRHRLRVFISQWSQARTSMQYTLYVVHLYTNTFIFIAVTHIHWIVMPEFGSANSAITKTIWINSICDHCSRRKLHSAVSGFSLYFPLSVHVCLISSHFNFSALLVLKRKTIGNSSK